MLLTIIAIVTIGLVCGIIIYIAFVKIPQRVKGLEKIEEINSILPGQNCGACGYPGCFGFAQALTDKPEAIRNTYCTLVMQDDDRIKRLEEALGLTLDASIMNKRALVHCSGESEVAFDYSGVKTCKGVAQLLGGNLRCPFACLGYGDCTLVCPQNAISVNRGKRIVDIDWDKCTGCGLCVKECPKGIIELVPKGMKIAYRCAYSPLRNIPSRDRCGFGCTHCRKCFSACEYGAIDWNKEKLIPEFNSEKCVLCLECIKACPQNTLIVIGEVPNPQPELSGVG
jgi:electron transport complex protein RnfB